jgi:transcriptional repressor NrdR
MFCPYCRYPDSRVVDSRTTDDGLAIRRRRQCPECGRRFSTTETASLNVIKRSGVVVPFSRDKIVSGVRKACQGRPVTDSDLAILAQRVEETVRLSGAAQIEANDIGLAILRFASVYQGFDSLEDFEEAITLLRVEHAASRSTAESEASVE